MAARAVVFPAQGPPVKRMRVTLTLSSWIWLALGRTFWIWRGFMRCAIWLREIWSSYYFHTRQFSSHTKLSLFGRGWFIKKLSTYSLQRFSLGSSLHHRGRSFGPCQNYHGQGPAPSLPVWASSKVRAWVKHWYSRTANYYYWQYCHFDLTKKLSGVVDAPRRTIDWWNWVFYYS